MFLEIVFTFVFEGMWPVWRSKTWHILMLPSSLQLPLTYGRTWSFMRCNFKLHVYLDLCVSILQIFIYACVIFIFMNTGPVYAMFSHVHISHPSVHTDLYQTSDILLSHVRVCEHTHTSSGVYAWYKYKQWSLHPVYIFLSFLCQSLNIINCTFYLINLRNRSYWSRIWKTSVDDPISFDSSS
jgi:hypothetical protein